MTQRCWVLWHRYHDGSDAHVERVYLDVERAKEDHALVKEWSHGAWELDEVPLYPATEAAP